MLKFNDFKLENGVRGIIIPVPGLNSVTVEVFLKIGSNMNLRVNLG